MIKEKINILLNIQDFSKSEKFNALLLGKSLTKKYSILKTDEPCHIGDNLYKENFCFFFYSEGWRINSFYCEIKGTGKTLSDAKIAAYEYDCNDVNRADCWEWVTVN
jgi:hypothetical protein